MRGLSLEALSARMDGMVTKQSLSKYERGKAMPSSGVLIALAEALEVSIDYLMSAPIVGIENIEFRKRSSLGKRAVAAVRAEVEMRLGRYIEVEEILGCPTTNAALERCKVSSLEEARAYASDLRQRWELGGEGIVSVVSMIEERGVKVLLLDAPQGWDGMSGYADGEHPFIVVRRCDSSERMRFTLLHELGHLMMEVVGAIDEELCCNQFANELLLSGERFRAMLGGVRHDILIRELIAIQQLYGVSVDALMYKAKDLKLISAGRYKYYCINRNKNSDFKRRVEKSRYRMEESSRYERMVWQSISRELITLSKAAEYLGRPMTEVRDSMLYV